MFSRTKCIISVLYLTSCHIYIRSGCMAPQRDEICVCVVDTTQLLVKSECTIYSRLASAVISDQHSLQIYLVVANQM